jgi:polysaccharide export outer membrane protein
MRILLFVFGAIMAGQAAAQAPAYILDTNDQIVIHVLDATEIGDQPYRIDKSGNINVPLAGNLRAAGLSVEQLQVAIAERLKTYLQEPAVTVTIKEFRSQPVSVLGAFKNPGIVQVHGRKTLFEVISEAGGLSNDAGSSIKITRRKESGPIPLPGAAIDETGQFYVAEIAVKSVMDATDPKQNIQVEVDDTISVPRAELVYVIGAVKHAGGFVLTERAHISVLEALSRAEGLGPVASAKNAKILRTEEGVSRKEIPVDVNKILTGKAADVPMQANDILFIPTSGTKSGTLRGIEAAIQLGTGLAIYRPIR